MRSSRPEELIRAMFGDHVRSIGVLGGGGWSEVRSVTLDHRPPVVVKITDPLIGGEERTGLRALRDTGTVRVPEEVDWQVLEGRGVLALEAIVPSGPPDWSDFATSLANLHLQATGPRCGFEIDNHLGATPQSNRWDEDWSRFNRVQRHGPLLEASGLEGPDRAVVLDAIACFDEVLVGCRPALLHGDLWSGNVLPGEDGRMALIDPAPYHGDPLADIAMMQLFGGFPGAFFERYLDLTGFDPDPRRLACYRLYHALNHLVLFGGGYLPMVRTEARTVVAGER
ncbi:MAG: fructosamine kinase family protein [Planctomycetota bacterium]|nr:fructosamine kinase family protein [Planctomycetota bacterium]